MFSGNICLSTWEAYVAGGVHGWEACMVGGCMAADMHGWVAGEGHAMHG